MRSRRLPDPKTIPEGVRGPIYPRKKCTIWARWLPVLGRAPAGPRQSQNARAAVRGPDAAAPRYDADDRRLLREVLAIYGRAALRPRQRDASYLRRSRQACRGALRGARYVASSGLASLPFFPVYISSGLRQAQASYVPGSHVPRPTVVFLVSYKSLARSAGKKKAVKRALRKHCCSKRTRLSLI